MKHFIISPEELYKRVINVVLEDDAKCSLEDCLPVITNFYNDCWSFGHIAEWLTRNGVPATSYEVFNLLKSRKVIPDND